MASFAPRPRSPLGFLQNIMRRAGLLYLAEQEVKGRVHYVIRESFREGGCFKSRDLFDLGTNPARYIVYPGGNAYYIDEVVRDTLCSLAPRGNTDDIEDLFWPFVKSELRRALSWARERARPKRTLIKAEEEGRIRAQVSDFDKRRIHYLRYGRMDQGSIGRMPVKLYRWLFEKSRDEIEQHFMKMERRLKSSELKIYTYVIFDLQRFFTESWAKKMPQGLDQDRVDNHFLKEICRLNQDASFWAGEDKKGSLHEYLLRYLLMFFDNDYGPDSFWHDYIKDFMDARRTWRLPPRKSAVSLEEASTIFGVKEEILATMTKRGLVRLFRRMAKKLHPDKGGSHEKFVRLTEAYHGLLRRKGGTV